MSDSKWLAPVVFMLLSLLAIGVVEAQAPHPSQSPSPNVLLTPVASPTLSATLSVDQKLAILEHRVIALETKSEKPSKDAWDKINAISGLISGFLLAAIGGIATYFYNERKRASEEEHNKRQLAILRVQTVQTFMPLLQSADPKTVEAALISIAAIDLRLARELAQLFQNQGAIAALSKMAADSGSETAKLASGSKL